MALAEARAAWQRTANRCLVQEDAKRAPKLACCSSVPLSVKHAETGPANAAGGQDIPTSNSFPFHQTPPYSNLSPSTKWWLQTRPNYGCHRGFTDEGYENRQINEISEDVARSEDDYELANQTSHIRSPFENQCKNLVACEKKGVKVKEEKLRSIYHQDCHDPLRIEYEEDMEELRDIGIVSSEDSKSSSDVYFDSESSWVGTEKNIPWWRTADTEELAFLVAQKSLDLIDNCDLPSPKNAHVKKNRSSNINCLSHSEISTSLSVQKSGNGGNHRSSARGSSPAASAGSSCRNLRVVTDDQLLSSAENPLRDGRETRMLEDDAGKARLLEALRHSQTRAREAETVAKQACAEKEHVVKLVFRQAQQLFVYKQLVQLLQMENMYFQLKNNKKILSASTAASPAISPWSRTAPRNRKMQKGWMKSSSRSRGRRSRGRYDVGKYAVVFALGLGLVGAGLLLGWNIGWMLPTW